VTTFYCYFSLGVNKHTLRNIVEERRLHLIHELLKCYKSELKQWSLLRGTPVTSLLCRWLLNSRVWCLKCCGIAMTDSKYEGRWWCMKLTSDQFTMSARGAKRTSLGMNNVTTRIGSIYRMLLNIFWSLEFLCCRLRVSSLLLYAPRRPSWIMEQLWLKVVFWRRK